ncbi:hypothetical protein LWI28_003180 [Acer negundo]|uniref:Uncharacterized protein n=1 Tax=Acer negundo TaxID=4023 RepID=A0AAD5JI66_ACENE|nr:hypothetical protein LWI28_003180 [Acer negundo]
MKSVLCISDECIQSYPNRRPPGVGRVRGRYSREDGPGGRQPKGIGRRLDDRSAKVAEAEAEVDPLEIPVVSPNFAAVS